MISFRPARACVPLLILTGLCGLPACDRDISDINATPSLRDLTPPTLAFTSPDSSLNVVTSNQVMIRGTAIDPPADSRGLAGVYVALNQNSNFLTATGGAAWSMTLTLLNGENTVFAFCRDNAGHVSATNSIKMLVDPNAPLLTVASPDAFCRTNKLTIGLAGTASHASGIQRVIFSRTTKVVPSFEVSAVTTNAYANWSGTISLTNGTNVVRVAAQGTSGGYSAVRTVTILADTVLPSISVTSAPLQLYTAASRSVTITGTADDGLSGLARVEAVLGDTTKIADGTTAWSVTVDCTNTENSIRLYARDNAGNRSAEGTVLVILERRMSEIAATGFTMGSSSVNNASPTHSVTFGYSFIVSQYETTRQEWGAYSGATVLPAEANLPVAGVSWNDAALYCNFLSAQRGLPPAYALPAGTFLAADGTATETITLVKGYRLPTEAEWEYLARNKGASDGALYAGGSLTAGPVAWCKDNASAVSNVGLKTATQQGLCDMSGNVAEWCHDWYAGYSSSPANSPVGPFTGTLRIVRGGSFASTLAETPVRLLAAARDWLAPATKNAQTGFRIVRTVVN